MLLKRDRHGGGTPANGASRTSCDPEEQALIEAAKELRDDAWAELYRRHAEQVYAYIYFRTGDRTAAEDLAADVFVRAIAGIRNYEWRGTPLLAWLYRIAHNVTADYRKAAAKRAAREAGEAPEEIEERVDMVQALDQRNDMMNAIRSLTEDQQQVLILRFYGGMSNAQVAEAVGKPETAVKALQARGLRTLRRIIGEGDRQTA
ncbi:MAG: sigma-70 family RNA polymerase sigma factor [Chloroflexi bacterium]|nr:sigma-70 family RNA polymerase sigma factor [Chloroflexota bacterium]